MIMATHPMGNCIRDFYLLPEKIGSGAFAEVYKAKCLRDGFKDKYVAIKKINRKVIRLKKLENRVKSEIRIHSSLPPHDSIVKFYTSFEDKDYKYLVLELCERGTLEEYLKSNGPVSEENACTFIKHIILGIQHLHLRQVLHRDLSLRNILLTKDMEIKIADFGMAAELKSPEEKMHTMLGTANFMPPEVVRRDPYDSKADCWSVGCILYALLYGTPPFDGKGKKSIEIMNSAVMSRLTFPDYASQEAKDLLTHMLEKDPNKRININDVDKHPFFLKYEVSSGSKSKSSARSQDSGVSSSSSTASSSRSTCSREDNLVYSSGTNLKDKNRCHSNSIPNNLHKVHSENAANYHYNSSINTVKCSYEQEQLLRHRRHRSNSPKEQKRPVTQLKTKIQGLPSRQDLHQVTPSYSDSPYCDRIHIPFQGRPGSQQMNMPHSVPPVNPYTVPTHPQPYSSEGSESQLPRRNEGQNLVPLPAHLLQHIHEDFCSESYHSLQNSVDRSTHIERVYRDKNELPFHNHLEYPPACSSCSHDQYCPPERACSHEMKCCCRYRPASSEPRCNSYYSHSGSVKEDGKGIDLILTKSVEINKSLKDIMKPLTTERLDPKRLASKAVIASILHNGEVCLEFLKPNKKGKHISRVCVVTGDGKMIRLYKPEKTTLATDKPPELPSTWQGVEYFTFENLPEKHWNKYRAAKRAVEVMQSLTAKVTVYGKEAKCTMMENTPNPNYEVRFYDGLQIDRNRGKWLITDQNGHKIPITNEDNLMQYLKANNLTCKWDEFIKLKNECEMVEREEEMRAEPHFPLTRGKRPFGVRASYDVSKENISPRSLHSSTLNRALSGMKFSSINSTMYNGF